jgi:ferric enterobactin receptor
MQMVEGPCYTYFKMGKFMQIKVVILGFLSFFLAVNVLAQEFTLSGKVITEDQEPVLFATVYTKDGTRHTLSDEEGKFSLKLPRGNANIIVSSMGFSPVEQVFTIDKDLKDVVFTLKRLTLSLDEVVVSARVTENKSGTSVYEIGQQAIQQVQAMHLGDVLSLLPGGRITPPDMMSVQQANLRTAAASSASNFGTAVIVDDAVISNDANMQSTNPATSFAGGQAVVGRGIDLRTITAANIESVEVITGVASPRHGDITTGAILVQSRVGRSPLMVSANMNPVAYQFAGSQGFQLRNNRGFLNTDISYTYSDSNPVDRKDYFNNINTGLRWRTRLSSTYNWSNTLSFQFGTNYNGQRFEPDEVFENIRTVQSQSYSLGTRGSMDLLGKLSYTISGRVENQFSRFVSTQINGPLPMASGLETGTYFTTYSPLVYDVKREITGLPVNFNGRLEADQVKSAGDFLFSFNTGTQYSYNKNYGKGRIVTGTVAGVGGSTDSRSAAFHEIPAATILSFYHESDIRRVTDKSRYSLRLGGRYDYMDQRYHLFSPRLSLSTQYFDKLRIRSAYGISYKSPALIQLYPGPSYHDFTNMSFYATNPLERMAIVSTYVHQPTNEHLKPSRGETIEFGMDWESNRFRVRTTYFRRNLENGIYHTHELLILDLQRYEVLERPPDRQPIVAPIDGGIEKLIRTNYVLKNSYDANTDGFELTLSPPKIEATNTDFDLNFSHMKTREIDRGFRIVLEDATVGGSQARHGVYEQPLRTSYLSRGNLTVIQHIPSIRLVFTFVIEMNIENYNRRTGASLYPYAYYDAEGVYRDIPTERRTDPEFANLVLPEYTYTLIEHPPFHTNYHLQVRKETQSGHSFSFYANNVFWYNPEYLTVSGFRRNHNSKISFGFSVSFRLLE